ncbi:MAG: F0F1 ATP synthase subunit B [Patescibacteria group bacterium]|jgi:F-type H+-transporting ATPase subunit b
MSDMLTKLGIDGRLFIAQLVNFLILFIVLRAFAWKPLVMALEDRRAKIKKGIGDAERAKQQIKDIEKEREVVLTKARTDAMRIMEQAEQKAQILKDEKVKQTQNEIEQELKEAKEQIKGERLASYDLLKKDLSKLITTATGKIVQEMNATGHEKLIQEAITEIEKS